MKKMLVVISFLIVLISLVAFKSNISQKFSLSDKSIDFGYTAITKQIKVEFISINDSYWKAYSVNPNRWYSFDLVEGDTSKVINISINRNKLEYGLNEDKLYFELISPNSNQKSYLNIEIKAFKRPSVIEALTFHIQNSILILKPYFDSTYSFFGSFNINNINNENNVGFSYFAKEDKIFADAGSSVYFKSGNSTDSTLGLNLEERKFDFYTDSSNYIDAKFYVNLIPNKNIIFDNKSYQHFRTNGGGDVNSLFMDSILSVSPIECFPEPSKITMSTIPLSIYWKKTKTPDDSVFVIVCSKSEMSFKVTASKPVNDDIGALKISPSLLAKVATGNRLSYIWIIRYRSKVDFNNKRIYVSQSQKSYEIKLN